MTTLLLVRHGETVWHTENRYAGSSDIDLTSHGRQQAEQVAAWARCAQIDAVYSSTLQRAVRTARPAAAVLGIRLRQDADLAELDFGDAEGMTRAEMQSAFPAELAAFLARPASVPLPRGESGLACAERATHALDRVCGAHPKQRILVVTHSTTIRLVLCTALSIDLDSYRQAFPVIENCSLTALRRTAHGWSVLAVNSRLPV